MIKPKIAKPKTEGPLIAKPRSVDVWKKLWDIPQSDETLFNGDAVLPDVTTRQRHLVGLGVDTAIIQHIHAKLEEGKGVDHEQLARYFPSGMTADEQATLERGKWENDLPPAEQQKRSDARLNLLLDMSRDKRILNRLMLVDQSAWETRVSHMTQYDQGPEQDDTSPAAWLSRPRDPRIEKVKALPNFSTTILDPGPKTLRSIEYKKDSQKKRTCELQDINRIGLLFDTPRNRDVFNKSLLMRYPLKKVMLSPEKFNAVRQNLFPDEPKATEPVEVYIPQVFIQRVQIFNSGYSAQMTYVAIDRCKDRGKDGEMMTTSGNRATIGEIKSISSRMHMAEEKTGIFKGVIKDLSKPSQYLSASTKNNRIKLADTYNKTRNAYEELLSEEELKHAPFPRYVPGGKQSTFEGYDTLREDMLKFAQNLPERAERVREAIQALNRQLADPFLFLSEGVNLRRKKLEQKYQRAKSEYEARQTLEESYNKDFRFPNFKEFLNDTNSDDKDNYTRLHDALYALQKQVNFAAAAADGKEWRREYVGTAVYQEQYNDSGSSHAKEKKGRMHRRVKGFGKAAERLQETDVPRYDNVPEAILKQICLGPSVPGRKGEITYSEALNYDLIEDSIIHPVNQAHWNNAAAGQNSRS